MYHYFLTTVLLLLCSVAFDLLLVPVTIQQLRAPAPPHGSQGGRMVEIRLSGRDAMALTLMAKPTLPERWLGKQSSFIGIISVKPHSRPLR